MLQTRKLKTNYNSSTIKLEGQKIKSDSLCLPTVVIIKFI